MNYLTTFKKLYYSWSSYCYYYYYTSWSWSSL